MSKITLLIHCPDTSGIIADVTSFFHQRKGNIIYVDQYVDLENKVFFMRLECEFDSKFFIEQIKEEFARQIGTPYQMSWGMYAADSQQKWPFSFLNMITACMTYWADTNPGSSMHKFL
ncbi:hypothetical protein GCM10007103_07150 [Salinimicrobium marinum]|uniref:ACT domain-containing protein n=1 Tax=Salinimicrobium marinum TaxID=680283 RepID=A0A918S7C8_9FLAO|nr:hypothetical protein GCM10007103_07150 [Salinimicrobium marinum]